MSTAPMTTSNPSAMPVTVVGLGAMGTALARAFLAAGHPTTVWNRTPERAERLRAEGASVAVTAAAAVAASPLTVVCLLDPGAARHVLDAARDRLDGATVVNLTSSSPEDARALAGRVIGAGARYLDGKIMVPTPLIGTPEGLVLLSGDRGVLAAHEPTLRALAGELEFLGDDPGLAALHDLGMLDVFFSGMAAFLHAAALVGADGGSATAFLPYARRILAVLENTLPGLATDVDSGRYPGDEDTLTMELAALEHIVAASTARGIDPAVPAVVHGLVAAAVADGHGGDGFSRVIDRLRRPDGAATAA